MEKRRLIRNVSANTFQLITSQVFGLAIFYALSRGLDKETFGNINWVLAILLTGFGILTFGIDQVFVRKIAAGNDIHQLFSAYLFHVLLTGSIFYFLLGVGCYLFPATCIQQNFLLFIGAGKLLIFFSTPFKQLVTGLERFERLFLMSVISNVIRGISLLLLLFFGQLTVTNLLIVFIGGDAAEFILCLINARPLLSDAYRFRWNKLKYFALLKASLPQAGVVIFTAIMSRYDWILIGALISSTKLAEYSFAWKIYEISTLPLLVIAPLMTPLFTRLFTKKVMEKSLYFFLEWQIIVACFCALMLNICWVPVIDFLTDGKYGAVNSNTVLLLSLSMPLLYFNNYLWTLNFAQGNLKLIFQIVGFAFAVNIISCSILVPLYKNEGAALANLFMAVVQNILYLRKTSFKINALKVYSFLLWGAIALSCGLFSYKIIPGTKGIFTAAALYILAVFFSRRIKSKDWRTLKYLYQ